MGTRHDWVAESGEGCAGSSMSIRESYSREDFSSDVDGRATCRLSW